MEQISVKKTRVGDVELALSRPVEGWWLGTFHALGARILRAHAEIVGLKSNFTILDADDQLRLLKQVMERHEIDDKKWPARVLLGQCPPSVRKNGREGVTNKRITRGDSSSTPQFSLAKWLTR